MMSNMVAKKFRNVKILHVIMMIGWPTVVILMVVGDSILYQFSRRTYTPWYHPGVMFMIFLWLMYTYFMLLAMRNYNIRSIATECCDFDAYLACMQYLEKFQFKKVKLSQRINRTDVYLIQGNFDAAYENLMQMKAYYGKCSPRAQMMYDYLWCRFYAEQDDIPNFHICMDAFRNNWIHNMQVKRSLQNQAEKLLQELNFRDMMFAGKSERIKADMMNLYAAGKLGSKYEFVKYCYYMGRLEYSMNNLSIAKHWFAQTVSFGLRENMSYRAADFLAKLDEMRVPYAAVPPPQNQYYCNSRPFSMSSGIISILIGLIPVIMMIIL